MATDRNGGCVVLFESKTPFSFKPHLPLEALMRRVGFGLLQDERVFQPLAQRIHLSRVAHHLRQQLKQHYGVQVQALVQVCERGGASCRCW